MRKERILVVEDEIIVAKDLQQKLIHLGYTVPDVALSAEDAIKKTNSLKPDIILMDIKLDGTTDGIDAATQIRKNHDIPIIYLTAYGDETTIERAKPTEPNGYMIKPFNLQELHSNIQLALHKNKLDTQLKRSQELLFHTIQNMGEAVITTDLKYLVQFINKNAESLLNIPKKEAIGKHINVLLNLSNTDTHKPIKGFPYESRPKNQATDLTKFSNLLLTSTNGKKTIIDEIIAPLVDYDCTTSGYVFILQDMTERRNTEIILEKINKELERRVSQRTEELFSINKKLENEIYERKKTEKKNISMKESLENIINSTSEMIIALDKLNRVEYWNNAAERITGYKKKDVIGRYINKVSCFEKPDTLLELVKQVTGSEKTYSEPAIVITKDYSKKIINISCSPLHEKGDTLGVICVGRDITYDWESHQNLIQGHSYLISDKNHNSILNMFSSIILNETTGLYISRSPYNPFDSQIHHQQIQHCIIGHKSNTKTQMVSNLEELKERIKEFVSTASKGVILINDIHYFITKYCFKDFINTCYEIIDIISQSESILLLTLNKLIVTEDQFAILESEFEPLPGKNIDDIKMKDELFEIIQYIYEENRKNALVSFKKLMAKFNIVYYTASKRVERLFEDELVFTKKYGKTRIIHLTEKGKSLLQKRKTI